MSSGRTLKLSNGLSLPQIGFGTWQAAPGEVARAVEEAIKVGYRHIDCALIYGNQNEVADGIEAAGVDRKDLTLVTKLWNNSHRVERVEADLDVSLKQLRTEYVGVWLIHWPVAFRPGAELEPKEEDAQGWHRILDADAPSIAKTWAEVVRIYKETSKIKAIGVSNFSVELLEKIINETGVVPMMNQIEAHPSLIQPELFKYCKEKNIIITAYSPLGNNITDKPRVVDADPIKAIAKKLNKEPAQVCIAWGAHQGFVVIPKSVTPSRIKTNFEDIELSKEDFEEISEWGKRNYCRGNCPAEYKTQWRINVFDEQPIEKEQSVKVW